MCIWFVLQLTVEPPSNPDTNGTEESVPFSEVSSFQRLQEWYLGWEKVSISEWCPLS